MDADASGIAPPDKEKAIVMIKSFAAFTAFLIVTLSGAMGAGAFSKSVQVSQAIISSPTITSVPDQLLNLGGSTDALQFTVGGGVVAPDSLSVTASSDNTALVPVLNIGLGGSGASRTVTVSPAADQTGTATITLTVSDGSSTGSTAFHVTVNDPPHLDANAPLSVIEGGSGTIDSSLLHAYDTVSPASGITYTINPDGQGGSTIYGTLYNNGVALGSGSTFTQADIDAGNITYVNDGSVEAGDEFQFGFVDSQGGIGHDGSFVVFSFHIQVTLVNHAPVAQNGTLSAGVGAATHGTLVATDIDGQSPSYSIISNPSNGTVTLDNASTGAFTYTPRFGFVGTDSFTFKANDGMLDSNVATVSVTIVDQAPTATPATYNGNEGMQVTGTLTGTDPDLPAQTLSYAIATAPLHGSVTITDAVAGTFVYTSNSGTFGSDSFTFTVSDGTLTSAPATVTLQIKASLSAGRILVADDGARALLLVDPVTGATAPISVGGQFQQPHGIAFDGTGSIYVMDASSGLLRIDAQSGAQTLVSPHSNFSASSPVGAVGIAVEQGGTVIVGDSLNGVVRVNPTTGSVASLASGFLALGVAVADDGTIFATDGAALAHGTSRVVKIDPVTGVVTPVSVGQNLIIPAGLVIEADGSLLVADAGSFGGGADQIIKIDPATGNQTVVSTGGQLGGTTGITMDANGTVYVPAQRSGAILGIGAQGGSQTTVATGGLLQAPFCVRALVAPSIASISNQQIAEDTSTGAVTFSVSELGESAGALKLSATSSNGALLPAANVTFGGSGASRTVTLDPVIYQFGSATVTVTVSDGILSASTQFQLAVTHVNHAPTAVNDTFTVAENGSLQVDAQTGVCANDFDVDQDSFTASLVSGPSQGVLTFQADGSFTYTPPAHYAGVQTFTYQLSDGQATGAPATVSITVNAAIPPAKGKYAGLITPGTASYAGSGTLSVMVTGTSFTGKLVYGGHTYSFKGKFNANGNASVNIPIHGGQPLVLNLQMGDNNGVDQVTGTLDAGGVVSQIAANRLDFAARTNPAPQAGNYTVLIEPDPADNDPVAFPQGIGYAIVKVKAAGSLTLIGAMGDGSVVSFGTSVARDGHWALFVPLYAKRGYVMGQLAFESLSESDIDGTLTWFKPAKSARSKDSFQPLGFTTAPTLVGARFQAPHKSQIVQFTPQASAGELVLQDGNLTGTLSVPLTLSATNKFLFTSPNANKCALTVSPGSGLLRGSFLPPGAKASVSLKGVIYQKTSIGAGFFRGTNETGSFVLNSH